MGLVSASSGRRTGVGPRISLRVFLSEADRIRLSEFADLPLLLPRSEGLLEFLRMRVLRLVVSYDCMWSGDEAALEGRMRLSPAPPMAEDSLSCFTSCLFLGLSGEGERVVEMDETDAEERDAAERERERERLREGLWSSMSSNERLRGLSWVDSWVALEFLERIRGAQFQVRC
jgi:hypothetical protein